jgi:hypothetical protein
MFYLHKIPKFKQLYFSYKKENGRNSDMNSPTPQSEVKMSEYRHDGCAQFPLGTRIFLFTIMSRQAMGSTTLLSNDKGLHMTVNRPEHEDDGPTTSATVPNACSFTFTHVS